MFKLIISVLLLSKIALIQGQGQGCQVCEAAVGEAQSFLENNATDAQILNFLTANVCYPFSGTFAQLCKDYITEEFPVIIQQLESESPQQLCTQVGLCTRSALSKVILPQQKDFVGCFTCKLMVGQVENMIVNNATEQQIVQGIEGQLCPNLNQFAGVCNMVFESVGPSIISAIFSSVHDNVDAAQICSLVGQC